MDIKQKLEELLVKKHVTIEATSLTGSGDNIGGKTSMDAAHQQVRTGNPVRFSGVNIRKIDGSRADFVLKIGDNTDATVNNGWGYSVPTDASAVNIADWSLQAKSVQHYVPVRSAVLEDVMQLKEVIVSDLLNELETKEGLSMFRNNDGVTPTAAYGGTDGLKGLDYYAGSPPAGQTQTANISLTGAHTLPTVAVTNAAAVSYDNLVAMTDLLDGKFWNRPDVCWHIAPSLINTIRKIKDTAGLPIFFDSFEGHEAVNGQVVMGKMLGFPVVVNNNLSTSEGAGLNFPIYLAAWKQAVEIVDSGEIDLTLNTQARPGFAVIYASKRVAVSVVDPSAIVRLKLTT